MSLTAAENKFFESRGQDVDASLTADAPVETPAEAPETSPEPQAAAPTPVAAPEPKAAETPPKQPEGKPPEQHVPVASLQAEREKRRQLEQQLQQMQREWQQFQQALQQPQEQPPDPDADPIGYVRWENKQLRQQMEQFGQKFTQQEQVQQQQVQLQRLTQHLTASEQQFAQTTPDYFKAAEYAIQREDMRLQTFYPDPATRQQVLRQEIANMVAQAAQNGLNPAQIIYQHAQNMGYSAPAAAVVAPPVPAPAQPAADPEVVAKIQKGLKQQSPGPTGGSTPPSEMTPEMLLGINDPDEFNKQWGKAFKRR